MGGNESRTEALFLSGLELLLIARPASGLAGGDLYCVHSCNEGALVKILLLDVTGHDEVSASVARTIHALLHEHSLDTQPGQLLYTLNKQFPSAAAPAYLAPSLCAVYDFRRGELRYANGGQPPLLTWQAQHRRWTVSSPARQSDCGLPLGVTTTACYEEESIALHPGDMVLLFSDGVSETQSLSGALLQLEGVIQLAEASIQGVAAHFFPLAALADAFLMRLEEFHGSSRFQDDITLLWLRRLSEGAGGTEQALGS